jgi:hypothetical protein
MVERRTTREEKDIRQFLTGEKQMPILTGPGPHRSVSDQELLHIFYLKPVRIFLIELIPIEASPPPGFDDPRIMPLLRRMLYLRRLDAADLRNLAKEIAALQRDRNMIAISARLLSLMRDVFRSPWAFPALLETRDVLAYHAAFQGVADVTSVTSNVTAATPTAIALSYLGKFAGAVVAHTTYMSTLTNRYYSAYLQKMDRELNLRGINTEIMK